MVTTSPRGQAHAQLEQDLDAVLRGPGSDAAPRVVHLFSLAGSGAAGTGDIARLVRSWSHQHGRRLLAPAVDRDAPTAFGVARGLLRQLLPSATGSDHRLTVDFGAELAMLLPELRGRRTAPDLSTIALGATKRRLHRDSERLFRLVSAFASIAAVSLADLAPDRPAAILIDGAENCDRHTLAALLHLLRTAARPPLLILITADQDARPRWLPSWTALDDQTVGAWTDAEGEQQALLRRFLSETGATVITAGRLESAGETGSRCSAVWPGPADRAEGRCRGIACEDAEHEGAEAMRALLEVARGNADQGAARALRLIQRSFGFTLNYELILLCCRIALASGIPAARLPALQFAGLAHAYLDHPERAAEIFEAAQAEAPTPEARAQLCYYRGLLASKRRDSLHDGRCLFESGLHALSGRLGGAARLERGWLRNGLAYTAWRQGQSGEAEELIRTALAGTEGAHDPQTVNLRINLLNNLSVLLEDQCDYAAALAVWRQLARWESFVRGGRFTKSYRYRESWLLLALDDVAGAYDRAQLALTAAQRHRDVFHADLIGAACRYLACRKNDLDAAERWAAAGIWLAARHGHRAALAHAYGQAAHVRYQAADPEGAIRCLADGVAVVADHRAVAPRAMLARALGQLCSGAGPDAGLLGPDDELCGILLDRPKPKLTTPFPIAHLVTATAFAHRTHDLALGTVRNQPAPRALTELACPALEHGGGKRRRDQHQAAAPGYGKPRLGAYRLPLQQIPDRADDQGGWLVAGKCLKPVRHGRDRHERAAGERNEHEEKGEAARRVG